MNHERRSHRQWLRSAAAGLGSLALGGAFVVGTNVGTATADAATYTSVQVGTSGETPQFSQAGNWTMAWSYDCSSLGVSGSFFGVDINQPPGDSTVDIGPDESGISGAGTDYYTDTGTFGLSVLTDDCQWSITVSPSSAPPAVGSMTFSSTQTGSSGNPPQFSESGNWTMAWSYDCSSLGSYGSFFGVDINQPPGDSTVDIGPDESGISGAGTDYYTDTGTFGLSVLTDDCQWSITVGNGSSPRGLPVQRIYGQDAIGTSIAVSQAEFSTSASAHAVVLARSDYFSDALAGGPLAASVGGPLLITPGASQSSTLDSRVSGEIQRVLGAKGPVYILGGTLALSSNIDSTLQSLGYNVVRIAGTDEYDTAVQIAKQLGDPSTIFEATGLNFADALSAVPAAILNHGAILLTDGTTQAPQTATYLAAHPADTRFAIGGPLAAAGADPSATAVYGQDLYATSAAVASRFFASATTFGAATGLNFPDALSGGVFMGSSPHVGPVLLVDSSLPVPSSITSYLTEDTAMSNGYLFGGPLAVGDDVMAAL